ncbi:hypothetical protein Bbelb_120250 [Branchiostoma belcheri]|nr:hypothetical protein Bbelb_120250 [Branchiostoma belcheri]
MPDPLRGYGQSYSVVTMTTGFHPELWRRYQGDMTHCLDGRKNSRLARCGEMTRKDFHHLNLHNVNPQDRGKWRAAIKPQYCSASTSNPPNLTAQIIPFTPSRYLNTAPYSTSEGKHEVMKRRNSREFSGSGNGANISHTNRA